jgi:hypothetical protein
MSWISKNYEKALVGGAIAVALGLAYLGWSGMRSVDEDFSAGLRGSGSNVTDVKGSDMIPKAEQSLGLKRDWSQGGDPQDRPVDLFTGVPLFIKSSAPDKPVDLLKDPPVHPPIPNTWWLESRLDPGFSDAPELDPDSDGFTNLEEFEAKTDPQNPHDHPSLIGKLRYVKDESLTWALRPGPNQNGAFPFSYVDSRKGVNRISAADPVKVDELFFRKEVQQNRFKLLGFEVRKEMNERMNIEMEITWIKVEDQQPNKKGKVYEFPAPLGEDRAIDFYQYDRTAVFALEAIGQAGVEFKVEENTRFALPHDAKEKSYLLKSVAPDKVVIEFKDSQGAPRTVEINKGAMTTNNPE